jgi:hypothetical protein
MKKKKIEFYRKRNAKHRLTDNTMISFERNEFIRKLLLGKDSQVEISSVLDNRSISSVSAVVSDYDS